MRLFFSCDRTYERIRDAREWRKVKICEPTPLILEEVGLKKIPHRKKITLNNLFNFYDLFLLLENHKGFIWIYYVFPQYFATSPMPALDRRAIQKHCQTSDSTLAMKISSSEMYTRDEFYSIWKTHFFLNILYIHTHIFSFYNSSQCLGMDW